MDQESWMSCEKTAILQGGFLLANQLCQPEPFSALRKEDWVRVGGPVVHAVTEICGQLCVGNQERLQWRKRILCIVWSKILEMESGEDIDTRWRENPLFAVQNSLPSINRTVLFELVKSLGFSTIYVELLLCFQAAEQCKELERLVQHVTRESTEGDVKLLLDVCWELLRGRREEGDSLDLVFTAQCVPSAKSPSHCSPQASKRFKPDPESSVSAPCMMSVLFQGLSDIKEHVTSSELCYFAFSNLLDMLYTSYLLDHATDLPVEVKLQNVAWLVSLRRKNNILEGNDLIHAIRESQRDLASTLSPAQNKPCGMTLVQAVQMTLGIIRTWEERGLLKAPTSDPSVLAVRSNASICRVLQSLEQLALSESLDGDEQSVNSLKGTLKGLLPNVSFTVPDSSSAEIECVATAIIDSNLNGFQDLPKLYASKLSLTFNETEWLNCIERNKSVFQQKDLVMTLVSTLIAKCQNDADVNHAKKLKDITVDIFSQLPLTDKNVMLSEILAMSQRGLHGCLPSSVTAGYDEELNLAFNCIVQGGTQDCLSSAVSAVACLAFQNPEATMLRCCRTAVVNVGADRLLAQILQQLSGLRGSVGEEEGKNEGNLLCRCLRATVWNKLSSPQEEDQFLRFLVTLMEPSIAAQAGENLSFLPPEECVHAFVLPYLSMEPGSCSFELCLRILQSALAHVSSGDTASWIMSCSPFPLLFCLSQLLNNCSRCWEQPLEDDTFASIETKELLISILTTLGKAVGKEVALAPSTWSRALSWLYGKVQELDWTVCFHLKEVWGEHFKYEVPSSLMAVCELPEQEWSSEELPHYGQGTGLLAWLECCCLSDRVLETMLDGLSLNLFNPEEVNMFSKGLLLAVLQSLPWCTVAEWERLLKVLRELLRSEKLHVPYSLEYVDFLPLLNLRSFACDLRLSVLMLRVFQLLCGCSCEGWLPPRGWAHAGRLYAAALRGIVGSVKGKLPLSPSASPGVDAEPLGREVLFVLAQLYCHTLHVQVMMPGEAEPLFLGALEVLSHYEAVLATYPKSSTALQMANTRHFLTTITDNLQSVDMRSVLLQKIAQLGD